MRVNQKLKNNWTLPSDSSITVSEPYSGRAKISVNTANSFTWSAAHVFNSTATFNSSVGFNSTTSFYATTNNFGFFTNYSTFVQSGNFYYAGAPVGSIMYLNGSQYMVGDADDLYHDPTSKRNGMGIGQGDTLDAKLHVVGLGSCSGTPAACSTYVTSETCGAVSGCVWTSYGSCGSFSDESSCNGQSGCHWNPGTNCNTYTGGGQFDCESHSGCTWSSTPYNCTDFNGNQGGCESASGCTWNSNSCSGIGNPTDCNNSGCTWTYSSCSDFNGDQGSCESNGCDWLDDSNICSGYGDESSCNGDGNCLWNGSSCIGKCNGEYGGSCGGDNSNCSGTYYINNCTGFTGSGCEESYSCNGTPNACSTYSTSETCEAVGGCDWGQELGEKVDGGLLVTGGNYFQFDKSGAGAPSSGDCDSDAKRGRLYIDTSNNRLYVCNGFTRGWDYVSLTN